jgi:hypothetical protein
VRLELSLWPRSYAAARLAKTAVREGESTRIGVGRLRRTQTRKSMPEFRGGEGGFRVALCSQALVGSGHLVSASPQQFLDLGSGFVYSLTGSLHRITT